MFTAAQVRYNLEQAASRGRLTLVLITGFFAVAFVAATIASSWEAIYFFSAGCFLGINSAVYAWVLSTRDYQKAVIRTGFFCQGMVFILTLLSLASFFVLSLDNSWLAWIVLPNLWLGLSYELWTGYRRLA